MKIVDVTVTKFTHKSRKHQDSHGHSHPGSEKDAVQALLTVRTDEGYEGYAFQNPDALRPAIVDKYLRPVAIGEDGFARERIWQNLERRQRGSGGHFADRTLGALDQALWDLAGRALGVPVYKLLGAYRDKIPAYGSIMCGDQLEGGLATPEDYGRFAKALVARGYKGIKIHTWFPPVPGAPDPRRDIEACAAVRDAVGPDIALMLDGYHWYSRTDALFIGRELEKLNFLWIEEPMDEASPSAYAWLSRNLDIPVLGPESAPGKYRTRAEWVRAEASDILRAGVLNSAGLSPLMKSAHLAEAHGMNCEIHGNGAANLAACLAIPNCDWYERGLLHPFLDYDAVPDYLNSPTDPMDSDGYVHGSQRPGLGEDINFDYIAAHKVA
ncbi:MAG: mandelate racemase [Pelagibacterium sp. SCN 64-44]|nr:MAG: mandelate racemase [Pelagibacterium sp. SCN 64-44]